jgi:hypothetical protein
MFLDTLLGRLFEEKKISLIIFQAGPQKRFLEAIFCGALQDALRRVVDGFALCVIRVNSSLKASFHRPRDVAPLKMMSFQWHHGPAIMMTSLKILEFNWRRLLISISYGDSEVFHWTFTNLQHHLLNEHSKKRGTQL